MKKALWIGSALVIAMISCLFWFYHAIQGDHYDENEAAIRLAMEHTSLVRADHVDYFTGSEVYRIVYGVNGDNEKLLVWVGKEDIHEELSKNGITRDDVHAEIKRAYGDRVMIKRIQPGKLGDDYVWEAFFSKKEDDGKETHFYEYYRFADGKRLDTWRMNTG